MDVGDDVKKIKRNSRLALKVILKIRKETADPNDMHEILLHAVRIGMGASFTIVEFSPPEGKA